jgi:putative flippase GtrA
LRWWLDDRRSACVLQRLRSLAHEALKFGVVGGIGFVIDVTVFNVLRFAGDPGLLQHKPLTAKAISVAVATIFTYVGNRHWTWVDRERSGARREVTLFFILNGVGMVIAVGILAVSHYLMGLQSPLEDNISANGVGLVAGMIFRFWSYRTFVFRPATGASDEPGVGPRPRAGLPDDEAETPVRR